MTVGDVEQVIAATERFEGSKSRTISVVAGCLPDAIDEAEQAMLEWDNCPFFQRAGAIVTMADRPTRRGDGSVDQQKAIAPVAPAALLEYWARIAVWEKWDIRLKDMKDIDPPTKAAEAYLARARWKLPDLHQPITCPTIRPDRTLLIDPGYDPSTGLLLLDYEGDLKGAIPENPTRDQAEAANAMLTELLADFPFVQDPPGVSLAVAMAALLSAVLRPTLPACPIFAITAPAPGTGKSYLADMVSILATGRPAVGLATGTRLEEFEKSLGSALLEGRQVILLDNLMAPLDGQLLAMTLSQSKVGVRVLGKSRTIDCPSGALILATGNNLKTVGDMARRTLFCRLDACVERPEERVFDSDLHAEVRARRMDLIAAVLTIARYQPSDPVPRLGRPLASFEEWCRRVRDPLLALGHADAVSAVNEARSADIEAIRLRALLEAWSNVFSDIPHAAGDVIKKAAELNFAGDAAYPELVEALVSVTGDRPGSLNSRRLSNYLARYEGRILDSRCFRQAEKQAKVIRWKVEGVA